MLRFTHALPLGYWKKFCILQLLCLKKIFQLQLGIVKCLCCNEFECIVLSHLCNEYTLLLIEGK